MFDFVPSALFMIVFYMYASFLFYTLDTRIRNASLYQNNNRCSASRKDTRGATMAASNHHIIVQNCTDPFPRFLLASYDRNHTSNAPRYVSSLSWSRAVRIQSKKPDHNPNETEARRILETPQIGGPSVLRAGSWSFTLPPLHQPNMQVAPMNQNRLHSIHQLLTDVPSALSHQIAPSGHTSPIQEALGTPRFSPPFLSMAILECVNEKKCHLKHEDETTVTYEENRTIAIRHSREKRHASHETGGRYQCRRCNQTFAQKAGLSHHITVVHERKRLYECPRQCGQTFGARGDVTRHVQSVHERKRPFRCEKCSAAFSRKSALVRHKTSLHEKEHKTRSFIE